MKYNKYTITTTTEAEDVISASLMELGMEGVEIEDKTPLSEQDKAATGIKKRALFSMPRLRNKTGSHDVRYRR